MCLSMFPPQTRIISYNTNLNAHFCVKTKKHLLLPSCRRMTECNNLRESPSDVRLSKEAIWRSTHCALYCNALQTALSIILIAYWSTKKAISCSTHCTLCHIALEIAYCPMPIAYIILHIAHWSTKKAIWNCANCTLYYIAICTLHVDRPKRQYGAVQIATTRPSLALTSLLFFELIKDYLLTAKRARGLYF